MKFTRGYWLTRENFTLNYAAQCVRTRLEDGNVHILAACRPVRERGDILNSAALEVTLSSPLENIIRVRITHFAGTCLKMPRFFTADASPETRVSQDGELLSYTSGNLTARFSRSGPWQLDFLREDGSLITSSAYHGMAHALDRNTGKAYMSDSLMLDVGEYVYGLGERFTPYLKNGQSVDMWNGDGGTASELAYKNIPFYMTNRGYGVFVEDTSDVSFDIASEKVERAQFSVEGETLTYDIIYGGTPKKTLELYTALTGRPPVLPAWSFGLWLSTSFTTSYDEKTTGSFIQGMKDREIPLSVFHYDCYWMREFRLCDFDWDRRQFPDPEGMIRRNHEKGVKVCVWMNPYIAQNTALFHEAMEHGYLLMRADGKGVWQTDNWEYGMGIVDFTNPDAYCWFQEKLRALCRMGIDCFKTDFGERIPVNVRYYNGADPAAMHNYYTLIYNRCVFEVLEQEKGKGNAVLFARSATVGSQQFPVHWGGDCMATYPSMAETLRGGLSLAMSGFAFWSHDISGFESTATPDLYKRWAAFGLLSSHSRLHGAGSYRVPWVFDEESSEVVKYFTNLKCTLMPYLYQLAVHAHNTGIPVMRPMILEFMDDPAVRWLDMQYMLGESLLAAPVFSADGVVDYYLPEGIWTDLLTGETKQGGKWYNGRYDYLHLPLYVRENALLPVGFCAARPDYAYEQDLQIRWYQPAEDARAQVEIVKQDGQRAALVHARRDGNQVFVSVEGSLPGLTFCVPGQEQVQVIIEQC